MAVRLSRSIIDEQQRKILLAQLFSMVVMGFMTLLFVDSLVSNHPGYSVFPAIFILLTAVNYAWLSHARRSDVANNVIIILLGAMCLYLFYTGSVAGTGPLWSFVFIPVAVFLGGFKRGIQSVVLLLVAILLLDSFAQPDMGAATYSPSFMKWFIGVYVAMSVLVFLNEYFHEGSNRHLRSTNQRLDTLFRTDDLTGLYNRRHIMEHLSYEMLRLQRKGAPFSVILFDIDHFKKVNDTYGHTCGDYVLKCISLISKEVLRNLDIIARIGGEEFLILLPDTHLHGAALVSERLRKAMEEYKFSYEGMDISVTISLGVTEAAGDYQLENLLQIVDDNLYKAKQRGRNRMVAD